MKIESPEDFRELAETDAHGEIDDEDDGRIRVRVKMEPTENVGEAAETESGEEVNDIDDKQGEVRVKTESCENVGEAEPVEEIDYNNYERTRSGLKIESEKDIGEVAEMGEEIDDEDDEEPLDLEAKRRVFEEGKEEILSEVPEEAKARFGTICFVKWGKQFPPSTCDEPVFGATRGGSETLAGYV